MTTQKTPFERLLDSSMVSRRRNAELQREFLKLDPVALLAKMATLQARLWQLAPMKPAQPVPATSMTGAAPTATLDRPRSKSREKVSDGKASPFYPVPQRGRKQRKVLSDSHEMSQAARCNRVEFTEEFAENATAPASRGQQLLYRDQKLIGFGLRVTHGSKSFFVEARVNGQNRRITVGRADLFSVEEARSEALRLLRQMAVGIRPLTLRHKQTKGTTH